MALDWRKRAYIAWLTTPTAEREIPTVGDFAKSIDATRSTLSKWREDAEFLAEWERVYRSTVGSPEKAQAVMTELLATATDRTDPRQVQAAKTYLDAIGAIKPQAVDVTVTHGKAAKSLSDDELYAMIAERAASELEARQEVTRSDG
jgi:hypothetical protein